jgi:class 3 adenylate cyclase
MTLHGSHTFLFADLVGYTTLTSVVGDERAAELSLRFWERVRALATDHDAEALKLIGDAVMVLGRRPAESIRLGLRILDELDEREGFPPIRIGMNTGTAVCRAGDWFGATVNVAARVSRSARGNEVLLTEPTLAEAGSLVGIELQERGPCVFKNVVSPVAVYAALAARARQHQPRHQRLRRRVPLGEPLPATAAAG